MLTDELERIENHIRNAYGHKYESTYEWRLTSELRTLQQQNKQLIETLKWIDEYRELNMTIAMNEWEEAAAFKVVENRVYEVLQSIQGGVSSDN